jgi:hypothetical protein
MLELVSILVTAWLFNQVVLGLFGLEAGLCCGGFDRFLMNDEGVTYRLLVWAIILFDVLIMHYHSLRHLSIPAQVLL